MRAAGQCDWISWESAWSGTGNKLSETIDSSEDGESEHPGAAPHTAPQVTKLQPGFLLAKLNPPDVLQCVFFTSLKFPANSASCLAAVSINTLLSFLWLKRKSLWPFLEKGAMFATEHYQL